MPTVGLNIVFQISAAVAMDTAIGSENSVSYRGESARFFAAITASVSESTTVTGTLTAVSISVFPSAEANSRRPNR